MEKLIFCLEHYSLYITNKWEVLFTTYVNTKMPFQAVKLHDLKADLWKDKIPSYMETHYKINLDNDEIESQVFLYCISDQLQLLKARAEK